MGKKEEEEEEELAELLFVMSWGLLVPTFNHQFHCDISNKQSCGSSG